MLSTILLDLSIQDILSDIPRDPGAIVVFLLLAAFVGFTWAGSRAKKGPTS